MNRKYEPYTEKHKRPKGFGSLCPSRMTTDEAQGLLEKAIVVDGEKLWVSAKGWCFCAHATRPEKGIWHGFPVLGCDVPEAVLRTLQAENIISKHEMRRLRKQRRFPESWS